MTTLFCSLAVLYPRVGHAMDLLSPFIPVLCHSDWLFHVLMLFIQAVRGLPRLRAPGIVSCVISFSRQLSYFLMVWPLMVSNSSLFTPALLRTHSFVFFAVHETRRIFLSHFISKPSRYVSSFFLRVQLSQPNVGIGHTSAFVKSVCCDFSIFSAVMPQSPALCLTWYGIPSYTHHLL